MQTIAMNDDAVRIGIGYSLLSAVTYGLNPVFAKFGYASGLDGIEILHARFLFALLVLAVACPLIERGFYKFPTSVLKGAVLIALLVLVPLNLLYIYALKDIPASMMSLITYIYIAFIYITLAVYIDRISHNVSGGIFIHDYIYLISNGRRVFVHLPGDERVRIK